MRRTRSPHRFLVAGTFSLVLVVLGAATTPVAAAPRGNASGSAGETGCPAPAPTQAPTGPSAASVVAREGTGDRPEVEVVRYPRPSSQGNPWSQWGQGLVLDDGRFLSAIGNHLGADGNSYLFVYDPATREITRFADVRSRAGDTLDWGYGKVHGQIVRGPCGEAYFATYWGSRTGLAYTAKYRGDLLFRVDPSSLEVTSLGVPVSGHGVPSLAGTPDGRVVFGEAVDPVASATVGRDQGAFFAYDTRTREVVFRSDATAHAAFRNVMVDARGNAYVATPGGRLLRYDSGRSDLRDSGLQLPGGGLLRASTAPAADGTVYGVTDTPYRFFALRADGTIDDLGAARGYTTSMAVEPDGSRFYYVPGAHGDALAQGTPLIAVDTRTGEQTTLAELDDLTVDALDLRAGGSYNVVLDAAARRLYVGLNAGASAEEPWGEVVLAVVHLPGAPPAPLVTANRRPTTTGSSAGSSAATSAKACRSWKAGPLRRSYVAPTDGTSGALQLEDATERWGADTPLTGMRAHAIATGDVDGDGWIDVFVGTFADRPVADYRQRGATEPAPDRLLLGGPDGFRVDEPFPAELGRTSGAAFADLDGDGDLDLVVARNVRPIERGRVPTTVYRNDGGTFTPAETLAEPAGARSIGLLDYDADGRLDLFVGEDRFAGGSSVLLRNRGDFVFEDVTETAGIGRGVAGMGVGTADLDGDGRPDLFVGGSNRLFLNQGGRFTESRGAVAKWATFGEEDDPAGVAQGDVNGDGRPDVVIGQHYNSTLDAGKRVPVRLYLNQVDESGALRLRDVTDAAGLVGLPTKSPHVEIADVDADGRPDIVTTAAGDDDLPIVFRNVADEGGVPTFEASSTPGPAQYWVTGATFDADRDGRLDLVVAEWEPSLPTRFLRNTGKVGHWVGVAAPAHTTVEVFASGDLGRADGRLAAATVGTSTGYSAGPLDRVWVGLGDVESVDLQLSRPGVKPTKVRDVRVDRQLWCRS